MKDELVIAGKVEKLWDFLVFLKEKEPHVFDNAHTLRQRVAMRWKQLHDNEHCPNCGANMCVKEYTAGILQMMLLNRLGEIVMYRAARTESFGDANNVHLDTTNIETSLKKQQSITSYFGLIEQPDGHRKSGYWRITKLGFEVLAGGTFPRKVQVHDKKVVKTIGSTTMNSVMSSHSSEVDKQVAMRKAVARDYRADIRGFDQPKWVEFVSSKQGMIL